MSRLLTDEEIREAQQNIDVTPAIRRHCKEDTEFLASEVLISIMNRAITQAQDAKTLKVVGKDYYCVPRWCRLFPLEHFDGAGGCWGISCGHVLEQGEYYCETCEYYRGEMPRG